MYFTVIFRFHHFHLISPFQQEQRKKLQLEKYQRQHPEWRPKNPEIIRQLSSNAGLLQKRQMQQVEELQKLQELQQQNETKEDDNDGDNDGIDPLLEAAKLSPSSNRGMTPTTIQKDVQFGVPKSDDARSEFEYFKENREEFKMVND